MGYLKRMTTLGVLGAARGALNAATEGFVDLHDSPDVRRQLIGFRNAIVWGHSITYILQKLSSREPGFEAWYAPLRQEMEDDPLLKYLHRLRGVLLKEGLPGMRADVYRRDNLSAPIARVALGEDLHGVWINGIHFLGKMPGTTLDAADTQLHNFFPQSPPPLPETHLRIPLA